MVFGWDSVNTKWVTEFQKTGHGVRSPKDLLTVYQGARSSGFVQKWNPQGTSPWNQGLLSSP
jgi:hypothetical protein